MTAIFVVVLGDAGAGTGIAADVRVREAIMWLWSKPRTVAAFSTGN